MIEEGSGPRFNLDEEPDTTLHSVSGPSQGPPEWVVEAWHRSLNQQPDERYESAADN